MTATSVLTRPPTPDASPRMPARRRSVTRRIIDANVRASGALERRLHLESDKPFWQRFDRTVRDAARAVPDGATIIDLGGGRRCTYAAAVPRERGVRIVAVDISPEELALNEQVDETAVANVAEDLPFDDASIDLIVSRALLEHVDGVAEAARHMARVLKPDGRALHFIPARYSLFGLAARLLPFRPLLTLLHLVSPETRGQVEFEVEYDHCYASALEEVFRDAGFRRVDVATCWSQSGYFFPCSPLYVVVALYQEVTRRLGVRDLAAYVIVEASR
jgi:ubiquinone/menaquinone biosynthesis C-methylase UbiE